MTMKSMLRRDASRRAHRLPRAALVAVLPLWAACGAHPAPPPAAPSPAAAWEAALRPVVDSLYAVSGYPGLSIGVAFAGGPAFGVAAGWSDTTRREALTPAHRLLQGSVGKTYAAALALQLVRERRLELDAPISRYLGSEPWFDRLPNARSITVRQLMNHTSGLVRYEFKNDFIRDLSAQPDRVWRPEELLAYVLGTQAPFAAGQGWDYSDTNYIVLGMILERITGRPYYEEVTRRFLHPLGLRETLPSDRRLLPGLAQGYAGPGNPFGGADAMVGPDGRFAINPQFEWTGGGMASTPRDLARWAVELYAGAVQDPATRAEMLRGVPAPLGPAGTTYGLGVIVRPLPVGESWGHSGFFPGYLTEMMYFPQDRVAIVVQVNSSALPQGALPPGRVAAAILHAIRSLRQGSAPRQVPAGGTRRAYRGGTGVLSARGSPCVKHESGGSGWVDGSRMAPLAAGSMPFTARSCAPHAVRTILVSITAQRF
jgi:D-alanyl-D-alanine carboxypeptidase